MIAERGYRSVEKKAELAKLGFSRAQQLVPALLMPVHEVTGEVHLHLIRPDTPRSRNGKNLKYEIPARSRMRVDVPPRARPGIGDPARPLFITEGQKKADAAVARGLCCIGLIGVWNFRGRNEHDGKAFLADFEYIAVNEREVYIVYDSDVMLKAPVHAAMVRLAAALKIRDAKIRYIYLPHGEGGVKVGLDDYFVAGNSVEDLLALATKELRPIPASGTTKLYEARDDGLYWNGLDRAGEREPVRLSTFSARILREDLHDDGVTQQLHVEVEGTLADRIQRTTMPSEEFAAMKWPMPLLGSGAIVLAVNKAHHHTSNAIQYTSGPVARTTTFGHTGWRRLDGVWAYLHGGGAIGPNGLNEGVRVALPPPLAPFHLPRPPEGKALRIVVRSALSLLDVGPLPITAPLACAIWRSVVRGSDIALNLVGRTGTFKTELAALGQQHFGAGFNSRSLPANWSSTANSIESLAFLAKDTLLAVDDFTPVGSSNQVARLHGMADRIMRAQGNQQGRGRCAVDGSLRIPRPPRGLILITGEDVVRGQSAQARQVIVEVRPGDIPPSKLTVAQESARRGDYASSMSAFVRWLAPRRDEVLAGWETAIARHRDAMQDEASHRRTATNIAQLLSAAELYVEFATTISALTPEEARETYHRIRSGLVACVSKQVDQLGETDPVDVFRRLLSAAVSSGEAQIADIHGNAPRAHGTPLNAHGPRVGWLSADALYLNATSAFKAAQSMGAGTGQPLAIAVATLKKRLDERGLLTRDPDGKHLEPKIMIQGSRRRVLMLPVDWLLDAAADGPEDS